MDQEPESADGAERAFEALREEVAALRQAVAGRSTPDYALTLGAIAKELQSVGQRLGAIEAHPALAMTPESYFDRLDAAAECGRQAGGKGLWEAQGQLGGWARRLEDLVGAAQTRTEQRRWIGVAVAFGVMLGVALWYVLPALLPWAAGDRLAASLIGGGPWQAGQTLMERASPDSFDRMVRLYNACGREPVALCEAAISVRAAAAQGEMPPGQLNRAVSQPRAGR